MPALNLVLVYGGLVADDDGRVMRVSDALVSVALLAPGSSKDIAVDVLSPSAAGGTPGRRLGHTATLLPSCGTAFSGGAGSMAEDCGGVLYWGGYDGGAYLNDAWRYQPGASGSATNWLPKPDGAISATRPVSTCTARTLTRA